MKPKFREQSSTVTWLKPVDYPIWFVPEFPLEILRWRDLGVLDPLGLPWRTALVEDIRKRGVKCPMFVCNHQMMRNAAGQPLFADLAMVVNKPFHLRVGRNRRWALRQLGYTHCPALVTGDLAPEMQGQLIGTPDSLQRVWPDGHVRVEKEMIYITGKADASEYEYPL